MIVSIKNSNLENLFLFMVIKSSFMFINILYYWIYMETRTKYGFGSFKNLDQGEYEITEIKTKPAEVQAFCYYQTSHRTLPCTAQRNSIRRTRLPESTAGDIRSRFEKKVYPKQFLPLH